MKHQIMLESPARQWDDGFCIGNGRLGAMIQGQVRNEVITLNEETIWYGGPLNRENIDASKHIDNIRNLLMCGEVEKATFLAKTAMTSTPKYLAPYLPAGDLRISFFNHNDKVENYCRKLDIDRAVANVSYEMNGVKWQREYFVSIAKNVLAIKISSEQPVTLVANLNRRPYEEYCGKIEEKTTGIWGQCGVEGVRYFGGVRITTDGGIAETMGDFVTATDANEVVMYVSFSTNFGKNSEYRAQCLSALDAAEEFGYSALLEEHLHDWNNLYNRVGFSLGETELPDKPTNILLNDIRSGEDESVLSELLFHFGRYLLISSSTNCQLPATLQGLWNGSYTPAWESKYTININTEMNYWPAEVCGLPECHLPLFELVERMEVRGRETARKIYGCDGFVAHHNTNLWADTAPEGIFDASPIWPMGGAWLSLHLYEHFCFTQDEKFLRERALPVLESCVTFFTQYLTSDKYGTLLSGPSLSPENTYLSKTGSHGALCMAPTMDSQILRELFGDYLSTCAKLKIDTSLTRKAKEMLLHLPKTQVSKDGRIKEWNEEYEETEPGHRHVSHLFGLYPGSQITEQTPDLFEASSKTLEYRLKNGGGHTGWSCAWIICLYARLKNGEKALQYLHQLLSHSTKDNLLNSHPPFQIDGNFGMTAAVAEMLVQSHNPYVELLPALPMAWQKGCFTGARLRGGIKADIFWSNGVLQRVVLTAMNNQYLELRYGEKIVEVQLQKDVPLTITNEDFNKK